MSVSAGSARLTQRSSISGVGSAARWNRTRMPDAAPNRLLDGDGAGRDTRAGSAGPAALDEDRRASG
jgi:hypothetical protein